MPSGLLLGYSAVPLTPSEPGIQVGRLAQPLPPLASVSLTLPSVSRLLAYFLHFWHLEFPLALQPLPLLFFPALVAVPLIFFSYIFLSILLLFFLLVFPIHQVS
jgi:hypothetical protein